MNAGLLCVGSSPRPWGTLQCGPQALGLGRFIPTPVGNAVHQTPHTAQTAVHPHARGERRLMPQRSMRRRGSSPRPWGTHATRAARNAAIRFIPTPVGNAMIATKSAPAGTVHPHARGERRILGIKGCHEIGSSPRPWGTPLADGSDTLPHRFIPTPVGNAPRAGPARGAPPVHPHARGERQPFQPQLVGDLGSSPRPWGTRAQPV